MAHNMRILYIMRQKESYNVPGIRRLGGLTEPAQMWVKVCVGTSEATDLANLNPGAAEQAAERIPFVICRLPVHHYSVSKF